MNVWQTRDVEPPKNRTIIAYCPGWCDEGYQICKWDGKKFYYLSQPNEMFDENVEEWALFLEAD